MDADSRTVDHSSIEATNTLTATTHSHDFFDPRPEKYPRHLSDGHQSHFFATGDKEIARARKIYLKVFISGAFLVVLTIFAVFPIYWGSLWKIPAHPLEGWIVDFDGGDIGAFFSENVPNRSTRAVVWSKYPADRIGSVEQLQDEVVGERVWMAIVVNAGASARLNESLQNPNPNYNGSSAVTLFGAEARNENAYRILLEPTAARIVENLAQEYTIQLVRGLASSPSSSLTSLVSLSPQILISPVSYTVINLRPFDEPVASAATFVGLIYLLILAFYIIMIGDGARTASGISKLLSFPALVLLRLASSILAYFFLSLFYALIDLCFQIDFTRRFGMGGFVIFWMLNWAGMMAVGLALESLFTVLTARFIPFFMLFWIIVNVSVCIYPIQALPYIFRYGYATPFYNVSRAFRTIAFGTRNQVGLNFGVLFAWIGISCFTLVLFQWIVWRRDRRSVASVM